MKNLLLVSQSPRRQQLLLDAGIDFSVVSNLELIELPRADLNIDDRIKDLAEQKARQVINQINDDNLRGKLILTADTMVVYKDEAMGKPQSEVDAIRMLNLLSGNTHSVKTGYCIVDFDLDEWIAGVETTLVHFRQMNDQEIFNYVKTGEPMDKAGAYGIQEKGGDFVSHIEGSYSNVVGLPVDIIDKLVRDKVENKIIT